MSKSLSGFFEKEQRGPKIYFSQILGNERESLRAKYLFDSV